MCMCLYALMFFSYGSLTPSGMTRIDNWLVFVENILKLEHACFILKGEWTHISVSIKKLFGHVSVSNLQNDILQVVLDATYIFDGMTASLTVRCPIIMIWPNECVAL